MMDERTTQVRNKIMSEMAMLMYLFVAAAFAVKVLLMGKGIRDLSLIHISEPTRHSLISYAVFCLKKKFF